MSRFRDTRNRVLNKILSHRQVLRYAMKASPENVKDIRVVLEDHQLLVDPATAIGRHVVKHGSWNREQIELIRRQLPANVLDGHVIEFGGNIGTETVGFLLSGFSHVYSVEPDTDNIERLNMNLLINGLSERATVYNAAVGSSAGKGQLTKYFGNPGANTLLKNDGDSAEEVTVTTGDKLVSDCEIDVSKVSLIWMDIEGFEIEAIAGMKKLLKSNIPLYLEFNGQIHDAASRRQFAAEMQKFYKTCLKESQGKLAPFEIQKIEDLAYQADLLFM